MKIRIYQPDYEYFHKLSHNANLTAGETENLELYRDRSFTPQKAAETLLAKNLMVPVMDVPITTIERDGHEAALEDAFMLTNHPNWRNNTDIMYIENRKATSSSVSDVFELENGNRYVCDKVGFKKLD